MLVLVQLRVVLTYVSFSLGDKIFNDRFFLSQKKSFNGWDNMMNRLRLGVIVDATLHRQKNTTAAKNVTFGKRSFKLATTFRFRMQTFLSRRCEQEFEQVLCLMLINFLLK